MLTNTPQEKLNLAKLSALGDPTRQTLLQILRKRPMSVGDLAKQLPVSRPAVSQHLRVLSTANLVKEERAGTRHVFSLNPEGFEEIQAYISSMWRDALDSFANYVDAKESVRKKKTKGRKK